MMPVVILAYICDHIQDWARHVYNAGRRTYCLVLTNEPLHEKTGLLGFRPGPTQTALQSQITEDGLSLEILNLERRGIVPSM